MLAKPNPSRKQAVEVFIVAFRSAKDCPLNAFLRNIGRPCFTETDYFDSLQAQAKETIRLSPCLLIPSQCRKI